MIAAIMSGGKQYLVSPGQKIKIEKVDKKEGSEIVFDKVLLVEKGKKAELGTPFLKGVKVKGKVIKHGKGKKIVVYKYKSKKREKTKKGHRQRYTEVEIGKIED